MNKKKLFFLFSILLIVRVTAQKEGQFISGVIKDSIGIVKNAHIINLATKQATFSNDFGEYRIKVSITDSLKITSVQHNTTYRLVSKVIIKTKTLDVFLSSKDYVLDEIILKNHSLTGILARDVEKTPIDFNQKKRKSLNEIIIDLAEKSIKGLPKNQDSAERGLGSVTSKNTDPTRKFKGLGTIIGLGSKNKKKEKFKRIISNTFSPQKIIKEIGEDFFNSLKIPEKNHHSFIYYCKKFDIEKLYNQKKILELIKLFQEKSEEYLTEVEKGK